MEQTLFFPDWRDKVIFSAGGPQPQVLHEDAKVKVVVVGLEPGGRIPAHAGGAGVYHFLEGAGQMAVGDEVFAVQAGATLLIPDGATRGLPRKHDWPSSQSGSRSKRPLQGYMRGRLHGTSVRFLLTSLSARR